jgi:amino-acid N-acetyltransferase
MSTLPLSRRADFVSWFRKAAPYIHAFRGKTFVIAFAGEVVADGRFEALTHDFNLLVSLGVRLVLVHGVRPQVEARLADRGGKIRYVHDLRVTDDLALSCVKDAVGAVRVEIEALLSMGLANSPMAGSEIRVASGNFVSARPVGVVEGEDLLHTGEVRKVNAAAIDKRLEDNEIVLLSPIGYSPTGEVFNLTLEDVASAAAVALKAEKLIYLMDGEGIRGKRNALVREMTAAEAERLSTSKKQWSEDERVYLPCAIDACKRGVGRVHLVDRHLDGSLLLELFTRDGVGSMVSPTPLVSLRTAGIDDVGAILQLIRPLEDQGVLVRRSREQIEMEINRFTVLVHDRMIIGCAALYPFPEEKSGELACLVVHPDFRDAGFGEMLLNSMENSARSAKLKRLFVLTTRTSNWFVERGFALTGPESLPAEKQELYNWQRRSKVFEKKL